MNGIFGLSALRIQTPVSIWSVFPELDTVSRQSNFFPAFDPGVHSWTSVMVTMSSPFAG